MKQPDLFDAKLYPQRAGFKERTTSRDAAKVITPRVGSLRDQVYAVLRAKYPNGATADEISAFLRKTEFSIRPRMSELRKMGMIEATQARRPNASGVLAIVWVATIKGSAT
jgi:hypothetical protein